MCFHFGGGYSWWICSGTAGPRVRACAVLFSGARPLGWVGQRWEGLIPQSHIRCLAFEFCQADRWEMMFQLSFNSLFFYYEWWAYKWMCLRNSTLSLILEFHFVLLKFAMEKQRNINNCCNHQAEVMGCERLLNSFTNILTGVPLYWCWLFIIFLS